MVLGLAFAWAICGILTHNKTRLGKDRNGVYSIWVYGNLCVILLQMTYDLLCLDSRSPIISTQNLSLNTVQLVLSQPTICLMSTLRAASSRRAQDWGNISGPSGWVSCPSFVVSGEIKINFNNTFTNIRWFNQFIHKYHKWHAWGMHFS